MSKIKILGDVDGDYGYPIGTILSVEELFKNFRESDDCDDSLYSSFAESQFHMPLT